MPIARGLPIALVRPGYAALGFLAVAISVCAQDSLVSVSSAVPQVSTAVPQVPERWSGRTYIDLHREYQNVFKHGNRNAASHLWSRFLLERSTQMTHETFVEMFSGFCAVSGSPVRPNDYNRYKLTLDKVDGSGQAVGLMHYCCWPCVCDTQDFIKVDTKTVATADGERTYRFAVLGNPCDHADELHKPFKQSFGRGMTTLARDAAEVRCNENGELINAPLSDHGFVIINMFFDFPGQTADNGWAAPILTPVTAVQPGRISNAAGTKFQDEAEYEPMCKDRERNGFNSGMGEIFRKVAAISPISIPSVASSFCNDSVQLLEGAVPTSSEEL